MPDATPATEPARDAPAGEPQAEASARRRRIREVDFTRPTKFSQDQQRRIARGHEAFCRAAQTQLSAEFRSDVRLEVANVDQQTWAAALGEVPQPSIYAILATAAGAPLLLAVRQEAVATMIERLLGSSVDTRPLDRDLTEIEVALAHRVFSAIAVQLSRTWQELLQTELRLDAVETQQVNIQLAQQSEPTLTVTMELELRGGVSAMTLLVPHRSIEPLLERLSTGPYGDRAGGDPGVDAERMVTAALREVAVEVRAEAGSCELTVGEVLALRPGDLVRLGPSASGGTLFADAVPIHRVRFGRSGNRRAVEVLERIEAS